VDKLPEEQRKKGRLLGLGLAMGTRLILLASLSWVMSLTKPLFTMPWPAMDGHPPGLPISGKDLILLIGGAFLMWKSTHEIHKAVGEDDEGHGPKVGKVSFSGVLIQIALLDIIFSLDSVITAVGMADHLSVMALAVIIAVGVMMVASGPIASFVNRHPTMKVLALSFLILIGTALIADGLHFHIPKGYIYFAMAFSLIVEMINLKVRSKHKAQSAPEI